MMPRRTVSTPPFPLPRMWASMPTHIAQLPRQSLPDVADAIVAIDVPQAEGLIRSRIEESSRKAGRDIRQETGVGRKRRRGADEVDVSGGRVLQAQVPADVAPARIAHGAATGRVAQKLGCRFEESGLFGIV